jgi:hypothetical protein
MIVPDSLSDVWRLLESGSAGISSDGLLALSVIALAALFLSLALLKFGGAYRVRLRALPAYARLTHAITESAESGAPIHLSAGSGSLGAAASAETLAGVTAVASLVGRAATSHVPTLITTASPLVLPMLQTAAEQSYQQAGAAHEYRPSAIRFAGDDRNAYAVSAADAIAHQGIKTSLFLGGLGDETLLLGQRGQEAGVQQIMGTTSTRALPYALTTADAVVVGEEVFAAGAYLGGKPSHVASLLAQDWLRLSVVLAIVVGVIVKTIR